MPLGWGSYVLLSLNLLGFVILFLGTYTIPIDKSPECRQIECPKVTPCATLDCKKCPAQTISPESLRSPSKPQGPVSHDYFNIERFEDSLTGPLPFASEFTGKHLLVIVAGEKGKAHVREFVKAFPPSRFTYLFLIWDKSTWHDETFYPHSIFISSAHQMKWWYIKRFLTPELTAAYETIWLADDDVDILFDPLDYITFLRQFNQSAVSQPSRIGVVHHKVTRTLYNVSHRVTDFTECGPLTVFPTRGWDCLWHLIDPTMTSGYGLDLVWCKYAQQICNLSTPCLIFDRFRMHHVDFKTTEANRKVKYEPYREMDIYLKRYPTWETNKTSLMDFSFDPGEVIPPPEETLPQYKPEKAPNQAPRMFVNPGRRRFP